jgi:hypothetical protein
MTPLFTLPYPISSPLSLFLLRPSRMTITMDGTGSMKHCACCGKVVPNNSVCGDCKDTYYCSKECQKKARPGHKLVCAKDEIEKDVLRAGWLINKLHFAARGHASDIMFHSWHWDTQRKRLWITYNRFPGSLIKFSPPEGTTEEERKMILSAMFCKAATAFYSDLLKTILEGEHAIRQTGIPSALTLSRRARCHPRS